MRGRSGRGALVEETAARLLPTFSDLVIDPSLAFCPLDISKKTSLFPWSRMEASLNLDGLDWKGQRWTN